MTTAEQRASESAIRALVERWAAAVHAGDLETVLADHSEDIQMFDVPPPNELRGIDNRLRLTVGLCREDGRWVVVHEHHSFPARD